MKKLIIFSVLLFIILVLTTCDNGNMAFVNDVKPVASSSHTEGEGYSTVIFVTADYKEKIYDPDDPQGRIEPDPEFTYTHIPKELPPGVEITGNLIRVAGEEAGDYDIKQGSLALTGENAAKYTLIYIGAKLTIYEKGVVTVIANNKDKFATDPDPLEFDYFIAPSRESLRLAGIIVAGALERTPGEAPGDYAITQGTLHLEGTDAGDWRIDFTPAALHIAPEGEILVRAISFEKLYGEKDPIFTFVISPAALPAGLSLTGALNRVGGEVAGDYYIKPGTLALAGSATDGKPYHLKFNELTPDSGNLATLTITKKTVTVTANSFTRVFNSEFPDFTFTNDQNLPDSAFTGALECEAATMANVGVFAIEQGTLALTTATDGLGGRYVDNYDISFVNGTLNITDNNIIHVTANPQTKFYGDPDPVLSYTPTEALPAGLSFTGAPAREPGENVKAGGYAIKQGTLDLTGTNHEHYTIAFVNSTLTINKKALNVIPSTHQGRIYGVADPAKYTFATDPIVDQAAAFGATKLSRAAGDVVGDYAITQGDLELQGNYATNYEIAFDGSKTFAITPCPVVITIYPTSKVKDDDDPEFDFEPTPVSLKEIDNWKTTVFSGSLTRDKAGTPEGEAVGNYTIKQGTLALKAGFYATNYQITSVQNSTLRITAPGPVHISDPVTYMKPIITNLHDTYAKLASERIDGKPATFRKADGPLKRDPGTGEYPANIKGETFLGSFTYWYDENDNTVYYYYGGPVYLYGDCHNLFEGCYKYEIMDMTGFNTQYVSNMYQMFFLCYNVKKLDLSGWSFNSVSTMANMFDRCERLEEIDFSDDGVDMSHVTHMGWMFAHNFYMTPTKLRAIIAQWRVKIDPNGGDDDSNINSLFLSNAASGGERTPEGANRIVSNDMAANDPSGISSSKIKEYIKGRVIPDSNGYSGTPPSNNSDPNNGDLGFNYDTAAYVTKDGISLYLGSDIKGVRGQRLNRVANH